MVRKTRRNFRVCKKWQFNKIMWELKLIWKVKLLSQYLVLQHVEMWDYWLENKTSGDTVIHSLPVLQFYCSTGRYVDDFLQDSLIFKFYNIISLIKRTFVNLFMGVHLLYIFHDFLSFGKNSNIQKVLNYHIIKHALKLNFNRFIQSLLIHS